MHLLSVQELNNFTGSIVVASSKGNHVNKDLLIESKLDDHDNVVSLFVVKNNYMTVYETKNLKEAIHRYNSI